MATIKLLLKESIKHVGRVGDIVEVSPGYARNYLLPKDLAVQPTPGNIKKVEDRRKEIERQERERREQQAAPAQAARRRRGHARTPGQRAGHLFGSVSATDIAKALRRRASTSRPRTSTSPASSIAIEKYIVHDPVRRGPGDGHQGLGRTRRRKQDRHRSRAERRAAATETPAAE